MRPVMVVAGARPNFMKVAPIMKELHRVGREALLVHTGQHYDAQMSDAFFTDLELDPPDFHLGIGSGSHAQQTARIMQEFEPVLLESKPAWLVVVGDVNSTLACALVAAKLKQVTGCRIAHVEAGLRSGDWRMPEEVNRVLTDRLSDLLLIPSHDASANLLAEGIEAARIRFVGNVMIDTLFAQLDKARSLDAAARFGLLPNQYVLATLHRPSNVDHVGALTAALEGLARVADVNQVVFPLHPRTRQTAETLGLAPLLERFHTTSPLGYTEMLSLTDGAVVVMTDSGGLQEETTALGVPCVTLREQTERPVTLTHGTNRMAPWPLSPEGIFDAFQEARNAGRVLPGLRGPEGWDGMAAQRIVSALD